MRIISATFCNSKNHQGLETLAQLKSCFARLQARFRRNGVTLHSAWERASDTSNKFAAACIGKFDGCESTLCNLWNAPAAFHAADAFLPSFFPTHYIRALVLCIMRFRVERPKCSARWVEALRAAARPVLCCARGRRPRHVSLSRRADR